MSDVKPRLVVAVVEDDDFLRKALGRLLAAGGFQSALFASAEAYIDAAPAPACLVLDVRLPGMSGLDLLERLRATGTAPPVIIISADHDPSVRERAYENGCVAFFLKPVDGNVLISTIDRSSVKADSGQ